MLERVLPGVGRWAEITVDRADAVSFPEEQDAFARAVDKRRREHHRWARARRLRSSGCADASCPGERGASAWPSGIVGSMTHRDGPRVRFWATPDTPGPEREAVWNELLGVGVGHIDTEDLAGLQAFPLASEM